ncbi:MAG: hypothetical protein AVO35_08690 [Candidatus Aegiribacteria sp. MLS_C]|nr:MAG: hypothetical protein AVO35_08690 [Candidatus Aegiribacteria sp. MLS_C]
MGSDNAEKKEDRDRKEKAEEKEEKLRMLGLEPFETDRSMKLDGRTLEYTARLGVLPLKDDKGETRAEVFFTAYELGGVEDKSARPLTFAFNGGPGSSSIWLHMGALGPRRAVMEPEGWMPSPPYRMEDNPGTWLPFTDLVFIDPVGTGFSRAAKDEYYKDYLNFEGDVRSVGEFILLYLSRYGRWSSPLYIAGESYGTTRAAGLALHLFGMGVGFSGLVLISTALDLRPIFFGESDDLPFQLFVPTYTATARYHGRLGEDLQARPLPELLEEVEAWVMDRLTPALMRGDGLDKTETTEIAAELARYTGLDPEYVKGSRLRIHISRFCRELLRSEKRSVGRIDSRFRGIEALGITEFPERDPSMTAINPPYTSMFNQYVRAELGLETDMIYTTMMCDDLRKKWEWDKGKLPSTGDKLRSAMSANPFMRVMVAQGYYDLATPHMATKYMVSHVNLDPELRDKVSTVYYEAGHMFYLDSASLMKLRDDASSFIT